MDPPRPTYTTQPDSPYSTPRQSQEMSRTPLSQRLGSLFSSRTTSPAFGVPANGRAPPSEQISVEAHAGPSTGLRRLDSHSSSPSSPTVSSKRLGRGERPRTHPGSRRSSGVDTATRKALREALAEDAFDYSKRTSLSVKEPPAARLTAAAPHLQAYAHLQSGEGLRHPVLLGSLSRSTFPTPLYDTHLQPQISPTPQVTASASFFNTPLSTSPSRTSIDSLRSLKEEHDRAVQRLQAAHIHTPAARPPVRGSTIEAFTPTFPTTWWFNNKQDVDALLDERDQADTAEEEGNKIRQRCKCSY